MAEVGLRFRRTKSAPRTENGEPGSMAAAWTGAL
jgi:hypothetical protein